MSSRFWTASRATSGNVVGIGADDVIGLLPGNGYGSIVAQPRCSTDGPGTCGRAVEGQGYRIWKIAVFGMIAANAARRSAD